MVPRFVVAVIALTARWPSCDDRWSLQSGFVPLPKSAKPDRMAENFDVFDFELSEGQMAQLNALDHNFVTAWDPSETDPV